MWSKILNKKKRKKHAEKNKNLCTNIIKKVNNKLLNIIYNLQKYCIQYKINDISIFNLSCIAASI